VGADGVSGGGGVFVALTGVSTGVGVSAGGSGVFVGGAVGVSVIPSTESATLVLPPRLIHPRASKTTMIR
jgi:hypothetical protein